MALVAGASCGESSESPDKGSPVPSRIEKALSYVPIEFSNERILFSDYAGAYAARVGFDESNPVSYEEITRLAGQYYEEHDRYLLEGIVVPYPFPSIGQMFFALATTPYYFTFDLGIWRPWRGPSTARTFIAVKGRFPQHLESETLPDLEYTNQNHNGVSYHRLHDDFTAPLDHKLRNFALPINRIALVGNLLLAAPATGIMADLIDVRQGRSSSLADSQPHRALALVASEGLLSGEFDTLQSVDRWFGSLTPTVTATIANERQDWDVMSPHLVSLRGLRIKEGVEEFVVALYYADNAAAAGDAKALQQRWESPTAYIPQGRLPNDARYPVSRACAPLSTKVIEEEDYSILLGACPVRPTGEGNDESGKAGLWVFLPRYLLYPDLQILKQASGDPG